MILAVLLAANAAASPAKTVAVLEFRNKTDLDGAYVSDQVRSAAKELLPDARVITRENMLVMLQANGKDLSSCEGECEVDTGRRIGADLVVSGELLRFGTQYKLNLKLHDTRSGELLAGAVASGATADDLDKQIRPATGKLLSPLLQNQLSDLRQAAKPAEEPAAPGRPATQSEQTVGPAFSAHVTGGYGFVSGNQAVALPLNSAGASSSAPSFGLGLDAGAHLGPVFSLGAYLDYDSVATDTFVHLIVYGLAGRVRVAPALSLAAGLGFSHLAASTSGPSFIGALDYAISGPLGVHLQAVYAHEANSDGLFSGANAVLVLSGGLSLLY